MLRNGDIVWHCLQRKPMIVIALVGGTDFVDCAEHIINSDGTLSTRYRRCCKINIRERLKVLTFS